MNLLFPKAKTNIKEYNKVVSLLGTTYWLNGEIESSYRKYFIRNIEHLTWNVDLILWEDL